MIAPLRHYLQRNFFNNRDFKKNLCKAVIHVCTYKSFIVFTIVVSRDMMFCSIFCGFNVRKPDTIKTLNDKNKCSDILMIAHNS